MRRISKIVVLAMVLCFMFTSVAAAASGDIFIGNKQFTVQQLLTRANQTTIDQAINTATAGGQNIMDAVAIDYGTGVYSLRSIATASQAVVNGTSPDFRTALTGQPTTTPPANPEPGIVEEQPVVVVVTATNPSATGFTLNFDKAVTGLVAGDIVVKKGADTVTCEKAVAADEKSVAVSGTFAAGEYTVTITKTGYNFGTSVNVVVPDGNLPSFTMEVNAGLSPGKSMVIVTLNTDTPQNYNVAVDGVSLNYNSNTKKFWGEVNTSSAVNSKVNVSPKDGVTIPSFDMQVNAGLSPGKSMVIVTLNTDTPQNYNVAVDGVSLNYNSNTKKFWGEVNTASAVNSKVNVSPKN